jgi:NAD(P)-dependent dehydrogenase (short-subunit alcohol dehydrogenase family)
MCLTDKVALISGGASGIGRATALLFAREGAAVSVVDLDETGGQEVVMTITDSGGQALFIRCDVTNADDCRRAVRQTAEKFGRLDILFKTAGVQFGRPRKNSDALIFSLTTRESSGVRQYWRYRRQNGIG